MPANCFHCYFETSVGTWATHMPFSLCHRKTCSFRDSSTCQDPCPSLSGWNLGNRKWEKTEGRDRTGSRVLPTNTSLYFCLLISLIKPGYSLWSQEKGVGIIGATISRPWLKRSSALTLWSHLITAWLQLKAAMASCCGHFVGLVWAFLSHSGLSSHEIASLWHHAWHLSPGMPWLIFLC